MRSEGGEPGPVSHGWGLEAVLGCPACESARTETAFEGTDRLLGLPGRFGYVRCRECGTVYQSPRVVEEELHRLYAGAYYTRDVTAPLPEVQGFLPAPQTGPPEAGAAPPPSFREGIRLGIIGRVAPSRWDGTSRWNPTWGRSGERLGGFLAASRFLRERAFGDQVLDELLPWGNPPGRALDVGCGSGKLLQRLARVGWKVEGAEWDPEAAQVAAGATRCPVHVGGVLDLSHELGPFDLVVLSHVVEHLPRPVAALRHLRGLLSGGGRIVLLYPNPESLLARRFGPDWYHWDPPRHLALYPVRGLRALAGRAGLAVRSVRTLSRWAGSSAGHSRALREGRPPEPLELGVRERLWHALEVGLVRAGAPLGEEVAVVLEATGSSGETAGAATGVSVPDTP